MGRMAKELGLILGREQIFFFIIMSRSAVGSIQPPIRWVLGAVSCRSTAAGV
jgi:hypothetical protein